ncbi:alpha/beta hydrolase [uncultured Croceitalea sp.]|uniref:alpha/beta hydrolase n=1 Tax=uncultured Croceitalea sp. TaxID=1798908 RepID=UPI0033059957
MKKITFKSGELTLAGNLYLPTDFELGKAYQAVIVAGSLTSVKEQMSAIYAKGLAKKGFIALAFDYANYGESEGLPRQFEDPAQKLNDLKAAITFLENQNYIESIGALGICTSGGNMAYLAADDKRLKAMATVAAWLPNKEVLPLLYGSKERVTELKAMGEKAREVYANTSENKIISAYSNIDKTASHFGPMEYYMDNTRGGGVKTWKNEFAVMSWPTWLGFDPTTKAKNIDTPTLIVHSDNSALPQNAKDFYNNLKGEKELAWLEGDHFDFYDQKSKVDEAIKRTALFFDNHLK